MLSSIIEEFYELNNLRKSNEDHVVNDDTQVGIEFAFEKIYERDFQLVSGEAIGYLFKHHPEAYKDFYDRVSGEVTYS